ncbi:MAG: hypothetical protein JJU02_08510 [Cryomorphaceae bacterium]|nr:hypothetical protein [Cryomorphaceae bacterium]
MNTLIYILLIVHVIGGGVGLLSGSIGMMLPKGGMRHRQVGRLFFFTMLLSAFSALVLTLIRPNSFLFAIGIFTIYMVVGGRRYTHLKGLAAGQKPIWLDWFLAISILMFGIFFVGYGVYLIINTHYFGLVYVMFGGFGLVFFREDWRNFRRKPKHKMYWLLAHISRMTGAYIASLTAFLVVNAKYLPFTLPPVLIWLLPSLALVPLIVFWSNKVSRSSERKPISS